VLRIPLHLIFPYVIQSPMSIPCNESGGLNKRARAAVDSYDSKRQDGILQGSRQLELLIELVKHCKESDLPRYLSLLEFEVLFQRCASQINANPQQRLS
jgi:hypothetical protein